MSCNTESSNKAGVFRPSLNCTFYHIIPNCCWSWHRHKICNEGKMEGNYQIIFFRIVFYVSGQWWSSSPISAPSLGTRIFSWYCTDSLYLYLYLYFDLSVLVYVFVPWFSFRICIFSRYCTDPSPAQSHVFVFVYWCL